MYLSITLHASTVPADASCVGTVDCPNRPYLSVIAKNARLRHDGSVQTVVCFYCADCAVTAVRADLSLLQQS